MYLPAWQQELPRVWLRQTSLWLKCTHACTVRELRKIISFTFRVTRSTRRELNWPRKETWVFGLGVGRVGGE